MTIRKSKAERAFQILNSMLLTALSILTLYPMLHVVFASLSDATQFSRHSGLLFRPVGFSLTAYALVLKNPNIVMGYSNTAIYMFAGTAVNMLLSTFGAYVLSRRSLKLKKPLTVLIMITMYFSGGMIPSFLNVRSLGMLDTRWAMILPGAISTYNMIILRTAFSAIPSSLEESAYIDGANDFTILARVVVPLAAASIAVVTMYYAVEHWNQWFYAMLYLRTRSLFPLQTILREVLVTGDMQSMSDVSLMAEGEALSVYESYRIVKYSTIVVASVPILAVYPFVQRYFIKGVMIGSVKG